MVEQDAVNIKVARSSRAGGANFNGVVISTWQSACFTFMRLGVRVAPTPPIYAKKVDTIKRRVRAVHQWIRFRPLSHEFRLAGTISSRGYAPQRRKSRLPTYLCVF